jgi:hypothetical protein
LQTVKLPSRVSGDEEIEIDTVQRVRPGDVWAACAAVARSAA